MTGHRDREKEVTAVFHDMFELAKSPCYLWAEHLRYYKSPIPDC